ncbi:MAG: hypothetical protein HN838_16790 [Rhodospirillaceae bacterium]|nr:hypothetical protein [Rhodospirillaceae bacterium]
MQMIKRAKLAALTLAVSFVINGAHAAEWDNETRKNVRVSRSAPADEQQLATRGQQSDDKQAPRITVPPKLVTDSSHAEIAGRIWDDSAITDVFINERRLALRADGRFRTRQSLKFGVNKFAFTAIDEWGNRAVKRIDVVRKKLDLALDKNSYGGTAKLKITVAGHDVGDFILPPSDPVRTD